MRTDLLLSCLLAASLVACNGDKDETDTDTDDTDATDTDTDTTPPGDDDDDDDTDPPTGDTYGIEGLAVDVFTQPTPVAEGMCVRLLNPDTAIGVPDGEPTELAATTIGPAGAYSFTGITVKPTFGLLVEIADCGTPNTTVYTSATGISSASYQDLADGAVLTGVRSFSISMQFLTGLQASANALGYTAGTIHDGGGGAGVTVTGDLETDGFLFAFVLDAVGAPIEGATVGCGGACTPVYYMDIDATDGAFSSGLPPAPNTGTSAAAGAAFLIPAAPIASYETLAPSYTFDDVLIGSGGGSATIAAFFAEP